MSSARSAPGRSDRVTPTRAARRHAAAAPAHSTDRAAVRWLQTRFTPVPALPPRIGFVSLGCPKALVDSERILTRLRAEGYDVVATYEDANLVVVNTCGFIDEAVHESLEAIGEAVARNGKVIVTGCLGARPETITDRHPSVLKVTGPQAYETVWR